MSPKILSRIWKDDDFWQLDNAGKVTFFWLLSNGETHHCGHLVVSKRQFTADTGMDPDKALDDLGKALPRAFVKNGNHLWLRNFMRHQFSAPERGAKSRMFKCLVNAIASMPEVLRVECLREYPEFYSAVNGLEHPASVVQSPLEGARNGASPLQAPCKGPEQSRAEQSRVCSLSGGVGETSNIPPVELPPGFPPTLEAAQAQAALTGVSPEVIEEVWNAAMATGARDGRDRPIRSWPHHVRAEALKPWRQKNGAGQKNGGASPARPESPTARRIALEKRVRALEAELEGHAVNCSAPPYSPEEQADFDRVKEELRNVRLELQTI